MKTQTTDGTIERGSAMQRHFVRNLTNNVDGALVIVSSNDGSVTVLLDTTMNIDFLPMVHKYGFSIESVDHWVAPTSRVEYHDVQVTF